MRLYSIIKKPIVTEKTSQLELSEWTYVMTVDKTATKIDIKKAILDIYWVEISSVRVLHTREKFRQWKKKLMMRRRTTKKAYVTLKDRSAKLDLISVK